MSTEPGYKYTTKIRGNLATIQSDTLEQQVGKVDDLRVLLPLYQQLEDDINNVATVPVASAPTPQTANVSGENVVRAVFGGTTTVLPEAQAAASNAQQPVQAAPAGPTCNHGPMVARSGVSAKNGKAWSGHFCPTPKGTEGQCDPVFNRG